MGTINFYLKKTEPSTGKSLIYLQFKYHNQKLVFSFGEKVEPRQWDSKKQRVKGSLHKTKDNKHLLNELLSSLELVCENAYLGEIKNGVPTTQTLKKHLQDFINQNLDAEKSRVNFFDLAARFTSGEIKNRGKEKSESTLENYHAAVVHLKKFQEAQKYKVDFDTITLDFFYKYTKYLEKELMLKNNTVAKDIKVIKTFMNEAIDQGYTNNLDFKNKKFSYAEIEVDAIYLTQQEIIKFANFDLSFNKPLEEVRDLFIVGCSVGLRYSDLSSIRRENIKTKEDGKVYIELYSKKTKHHQIIPTDPLVLKIFDKYSNNSNKLPVAISNQKFNEYIKQAANIARMREKGRLISEPDKELWQCISSHTARRSYVTNRYLEGVPTLEIMAITGHKSEKSFLKYFRLTKLQIAKRLSDHNERLWNQKANEK